MRLGIPVLLILLLAPVFLSCEDTVDKEFVVKGSNPVQKVSVRVFKKCEDFETGVEVRLNAMVKYGQQSAELRAEFNKVLLISQYAERLKAVCAAQCQLMHNTVILDISTSDYTFYSDIVKDYTEYQKVKDLLDGNPSEEERKSIAEAILGVYKKIYNNKLKELPDFIRDLEITLATKPGAVVTVEINGVVVDQIAANDNGDVHYTLKKEYLIEKPGENTKVKFRVTAAGYEVKVSEAFLLSELQYLAVQKSAVRMN